jgi:polygalacturonase
MISGLVRCIRFMLLTAVIGLGTPAGTADPATYIITDYGALGDGVTKCTAAIQNAVDAASATGGGTVLVPPGTFVSGTLWLKSNVHLHLDAGGVLKGSPAMSDYRTDGVVYGLIRAEEAENLTISGPGEINGNGTHFMSAAEPHLSADFDKAATRQGVDFMSPRFGFEDGPMKISPRPGMTAVFQRCENVTLDGVAFRDSPSWTIRFGDCDGVLVRGISIINNLLVPNSDGVHCTTSRNIRISDCDIRAGDDAIIVTGFGDDDGAEPRTFEPNSEYPTRTIGNKTGFAENVTVTNCVLQSRSAGIRVGYGNNSIRNCLFQNIVIYGSNRGIGVFSRDRGSIDNILFSDIIIENRLHSGHWWGKGEPIHVSAIPQNEKIPCGKVSNVRFRNVIAESETGIVVWGQGKEAIQDLLFEDVQLTVRNGALSRSYGGNFDLRPAYAPQFRVFRHDIPGMFCRFVRGLQIRNFDLRWGEQLESYFTSGIEVESVQDLILDGFRGSQAPGRPDAAAVSLSDIRGCTVRNCEAKQGTSVFLRHRNLQAVGLFVNNDLSGAKAAFEPKDPGFDVSGNRIP